MVIYLQKLKEFLIQGEAIPDIGYRISQQLDCTGICLSLYRIPTYNHITVHLVQKYHTMHLAMELLLFEEVKLNHKRPYSRKQATKIRSRKIRILLRKILQPNLHHLEKKVRFIKRDWVVSTGSIFIRQDVTKTDQILHHTVYGFGNLQFLQLA